MVVALFDKTKHLNIPLTSALYKRGRPKKQSAVCAPQKTPSEQLKVWIFSRLELSMRQLMKDDPKVFHKILNPALAGSVLEGLLLIGQITQDQYESGKDFQCLLHRYMYASQMRLVVSSSLSRYADHTSKYNDLDDEDITKEWFKITEELVQLTWNREGISFLIKQLNPSNPFYMMMLQREDLLRLRYYLGKLDKIFKK